MKISLFASLAERGATIFALYFFRQVRVCKTFFFDENHPVNYKVNTRALGTVYCVDRVW